MLARVLVPLALCLAAAGCSAAPKATPAADRPALGLMTSLPIYWAESEDFGAVLASDAPASWVRQALEDAYVLEPVDTLEPKALSRLRFLLLAQPRPLAPAENAALDEWVRRGGRLLLFADPMLTALSHYPIGDRRRPQDVALLSPILRHWGLELQFDDAQPDAESIVDAEGMKIPVRLRGSFQRSSGKDCKVIGEGALADCGIGSGRVVLLADAAVFESPAEGEMELRRVALKALLRKTFQ